MPVEIRRALIGTSFGQIHCREAGAGPAIVLLHINQQSSAVFIEMIEALAPCMHTIAIDYPSHGGSDHVAKQPTIADYARCVVEVMDALGAGKFVALGEATGAAVAVELAAAHPDRIERIVLVNCPFLDSQLSVEALIAPFQAKFRPSDESGFSLECSRHDESGIRVPVPIKEPTPRNRTTVHPRPAPLMHPISPWGRGCGQEVLRGKGLILRASDTHVARAPHGATATSLRVSQTSCHR